MYVILSNQHYISNLRSSIPSAELIEKLAGYGVTRVSYVLMLCANFNMSVLKFSNLITGAPEAVPNVSADNEGDGFKNPNRPSPRRRGRGKWLVII